MIKKSVTYTDYNNNERTEDFHFNLTKAEVIEMEHNEGGTLSEQLTEMTKTQDLARMIRFFKWLVLKAYGVKSEDGRRFIKSEEISNEFSQTEAYSEIFMELATNDVAAAEFVNGILPKVTAAEQKAIAVSNGTGN